MNTVKVKTHELLSKLTQNREAHATELKIAQEGYRLAAIAAFEHQLATAKAGGKIIRRLELQEPQDHLAEYDQAIEMLKMSTEQITEVTERDFKQYVMDNWDWSQVTKAVNLSYVH